MNYRRIIYFLAVVDKGTITAAARSIPIAQPALSRQIRNLENELRLTLFTAQRNRLTLTPAGRAFVPVARRLVKQMHAMEGAADLLRMGHVESLELAATAASIRSFIAPFISTTTAQDPILLVRETEHFKIPASLDHGVDFIVSPALPGADLETLALGQVPISAHVAPQHPWAQQTRDRVELAELTGHTVLLPSLNSVSRHILDTASNRSGQGFTSIYECDDGPTLHALAAAGHGIGITTEASNFATYCMPIYDDTGLVLGVPLYIAWPAGHFATATIKSLATRIQAYFQKRLAI